MPTGSELGALPEEILSVWQKKSLAKWLDLEQKVNDMALKMEGVAKAANQFSSVLGAAPVKQSAKPGVGKTTATKKVGGVESVLVDKQEEVHPPVMIPPDKLCMVYISGSQTINLGNYESAKVTVGVTLPCTFDALDSTYEAGSEWVSEKIIQASKDVKG